MLEALLFFPLCAGLLAFQAGPALRRALLPLTALVYAGLSACVVWVAASGSAPLSALGGLLEPDALGALFLMITAVLFLAVSCYAPGYLREESKKAERTGIQDGKPFTNAPERRFVACLCFFLAAMTLVCLTRHLGLLWMGIELTTLASAPLIYFHRHRASLEATWKYLIICSVGIALALLGTILLSMAFYVTDGTVPGGADQIAAFSGLASSLARAGEQMQQPWLKAAFIFILVGYGTKMGLAPLHNWLPDAHSQAPSLVSALLSGALLNCALLGILRGHQIMLAAQLGQFSSGLLVFFGLLSLFAAAVFIVGQGHYKRLLAYSSVEHMGILALGVGIGGTAVFGALLHALCHSLTKCMLFLVAGNILLRYHTFSSHDVRGLRWTMPMSGLLWTAGFLAIAGSPPFGVFISEFLILKGMAAAGNRLVAGLYLVLLAVIFVGMSVPALRMVQGNRPPDMSECPKEPLWSVAAPLVLCALVLGLGLYIPAWLTEFLTQGAALIGGKGYGIPLW